MIFKFQTQFQFQTLPNVPPSSMFIVPVVQCSEWCYRTVRLFYCTAHKECVVSVTCCTMFGILGVGHGPLGPQIRPAQWTAVRCFA